MKRPQWLTIIISLILIPGIYFFGKTTSPKKKIDQASVTHSPDDGHDHGVDESLSTDSILALAKSRLTPQQIIRVNSLENSISRGDIKNQQLRLVNQLARFWADSARIFEPYAWYTAEAARLENSEKTLTFAAHLFLDNLQQNSDPHMIKWKALQAKDLFERSLKLNPDNDSSKVGLGACYLFGGISPNPMEGLEKIKEVIAKDSTHIYGQMTMAKASLISGQNDKAINRLQTVVRLEPGNLEAVLMLADLYERMGEKSAAISWYEKSIPYLPAVEIRKEIENRIEALKK